MFTLSKGVFVLLLALMIPQQGHSVPETLTKTDVLKILYGSFCSLYGSDIRQAFSDKQRYFIHYSKNNFFTDPKGGLNFDAHLGHFPALHKLMRLWTLDLNYKPSFLNFRKIPIVLSKVIDDIVDFDTLDSLANDAFSFDEAKFKLIQAELGIGSNFTPIQVMKILMEELKQNMDDQKRQGIIGAVFLTHLQILLDGNNVFFGKDESLYQVKFKKTNVQRYTLKTIDAKPSKLVLTITDNFNAEEAVARAKFILDLLEIRYNTVEELVSQDRIFVDESFFERYTPAEIRTKFDDASTIVLRVNELLSLSTKAGEDSTDEATNTVTFILNILLIYVTYYNNNFKPAYTFISE